MHRTKISTGFVEFKDVVNGDFVFGDMPTGTLSAISLLDAEVQAAPGAVGTLVANILSLNNLDGTALIVNVRDAGTDGYASTEGWISGSTCTGWLCTAEFEVPLSIRASKMDLVSDEEEIGIEMSLGLYTPNGPVFTASELLPDPWIVDKQPVNTIAMSGRLTYQRQHQVGVPNPNDPTHPQWGIMQILQETNPLRRMTVDVSDTCSHTYTTRTSETGFWHMYVPKECVNTTYTVEARAETSFGIYSVRSRDFNENVHVVEVGSASVPGTSKWWGVTHFDALTAEFGFFSTFMVGLEVQEWAKPYLVGDAKVSGFPWLNFSFEAGELADADCGKTSCYGDQVIYVGSGPDNKDEFDEWALTHECFHWFQDMFMAKLNGNESSSPYAWAGAFGEGFASTMPAIMRGDVWTYTYLKGWADAGLIEFQGSFTEAGGIPDNWFPALPFDLYNTENDKANGGWSGRILWDFFDDSDIEPEREFARYDDDGSSDISVSNPTVVDYGIQFDDIGSASAFQDVIVRYLGGNYMPANSYRPSLDSRGSLGLDMTEFLDGMICRGHYEWEDMEYIVFDMMDFNYDFTNAPSSCP